MTQLGRHSWVGARVVSKVLASCGTGCLRILTDVFAPCDPIHTGPFGSGRILYCLARVEREPRSGFRGIDATTRCVACRPVGVGVSRRYYHRGTRLSAEPQWQCAERVSPTSRRASYKLRYNGLIYEPTIRIPGRAVPVARFVSGEWRERASATVGRPSPAGYSIRGARGSPPGSSLTRPGRRRGSAVGRASPPWRGGGGQCACARPAGTRTPRERPRARGRPAAPRYPRRTHPATRDRFPATPAEAFRLEPARFRAGRFVLRRRDSRVRCIDGRSAVHADRTTLGFALGMICARMNYSTPTVVYGYAHECGMRARARPPAAEPPSALSRPSDPLPHGPRAEQHR